MHDIGKVHEFALLLKEIARVHTNMANAHIKTFLGNFFCIHQSEIHPLISMHFQCELYKYFTRHCLTQLSSHDAYNVVCCLYNLWIMTTQYLFPKKYQSISPFFPKMLH